MQLPMKSRNKSILFFLLAMLQFLAANAQDTSKTLGPQQFFDWVVRYHPVSRQAALVSASAIANLRKARGSFDPYLYSETGQKFYSGSNYFLISESGLKIPTWYGIELKAGYDYNNGAQLNPERTVPTVGLANVALSADLGAGLLMNDRMAAVRRAKIFVKSSEAERRNMLNDLLRDAAMAYWNWVAAWRKREVYREALSLSEFRFTGIVSSFVQGDVPAIDTLEAYIQVQTRQTQWLEADMLLKNEALKLSNFLWYENDIPLELEENTQPKDFLMRNTISADSIRRQLERLPETHPELLRYRYKLAELDVERKLKAEKLRPVLRVEYGMLAPGFDYGNAGLIGDNYKWGINFKYPVFVRDARGDLALTKIKMETTRYDQQLKTLQISNKVAVQENYLRTLDTQIGIFGSAVENYRALLDAETTRLELGESSVFLVNRREVFLIDAGLKLVDYETKYQKALAELAHAMGVIAQ
jgi:outer membrane protein TolC